MSTLVIDELFDGIVFEQDIRISENISLAWIRPWIYKQGTLVDGQFRLEVYDGATLIKTVDIDYSEINSNITAPYAHGYIRFDVSPLNLNKEDTEETHVYTLKFSMVNHTTDLNNYIAICREWDQLKYPIFGTPPVDDNTAPMGLELYTYRS
jgi:hypothetical protein